MRSLWQRRRKYGAVFDASFPCVSHNYTNLILTLVAAVYVMYMYVHQLTSAPQFGPQAIQHVY